MFTGGQNYAKYYIMNETNVLSALRVPYRAVRTLGGRYLKRPLLETYADWSDKPLKGSLFGKLAPLVPPLRLMHDGIADYHAFKANGEEFARILKEKCGLLPSHRMLDIGCGIGRKTLPLLTYLDPAQGRYEGVDIFKSGIEWCQKRITPRFSNFHFQLMDVYNGVYNPESIVKARDYRFPFADNSFDIILLGSVFTHTLMEDTLNYLSEIARMLKPGGRSLISYFLSNAESEGLIAQGKSEHAFIYSLGPCKVTDPNSPEAAVSYREEDIVAAYRERALEIEGGIQYGSWCGRKQFLSFQDLIIGRKLNR